MIKVICNFDPWTDEVADERCAETLSIVKRCGRLEQFERFINLCFPHGITEKRLMKLLTKQRDTVLRACEIEIKTL
jgi:hypothetical protein